MSSIDSYEKYVSTPSSFDEVSTHPSSFSGLGINSTPTEPAVLGMTFVAGNTTSQVAFAIAQHLYPTAVRYRDEFLLTLSNENGASDVSSPIQLLALFLGHLSDLFGDEKTSTPGAGRVLNAALSSFERDYLQSNDIHAVLEQMELPTSTKTEIIRSYVLARSLANRPRAVAPSNLLTAAREGRATVYTTFGGQGNDEFYFNEIRQTYRTYRPLVEDLVGAAAVTLRSGAQNPQFQEYYPQGMDILSWLENPESAPSTEYLTSAPVSFPLIGLSQLMHYRITLSLLGCEPSDISGMLAGSTGHSQGIVVAAMVAAADSGTSFDSLCQQALRVLLSIGVRSQEAFAASGFPAIVPSSEGSESRTPMLSVRGLSQVQVEREVEAINKKLGQDSCIEVSLINDHQNIVVTGPPMSLYAFSVHLKSKSGSSNQTKIPFSQRKPEISQRFLPVSAPFHGIYLATAASEILSDCKDIQILGRDLLIPVYATDDGADLRTKQDANILPDLVRMVTDNKVDWPGAIQFPNATHVVDFGPGGASGAGALVNKIKEGSGVRVVLATTLDGSNRDFGYKFELFDRDQRNSVPRSVSWADQFSPRVIRTSSGETYVDTKLSRLLALPPVLVAGMTPTTSAWEFVADTMNAGYHIEFACGGHHNAKSLASAIKKLVATAVPGRGITCNIIYANPVQIKWQIPELRRLRSEGIPIEGLTIGAGVPSPEVIKGYVEDLRLKHIGLKPGSAEAIQRVLDVAKALPSTPFILQWTGGRGGGHHSCEDFHQPIVQMYGKIRDCSNVVLVAGSGFGGSEDTLRYMTGSWSTERGLPAMPFDGVLVGSRAMIAREAKTSRAVKELIAQTAGVADKDWEETFQSGSGGVLSVISEMGEPIHKIATRGVKLWAELDRTIFKLDKSKRMAAIEKRRSYLIRRLNDDFQKVWFGRCSQTGEAAEIDDMTYLEVLQRFVELTYVESERRWIDASWQQMLFDFATSVESRLTTHDTPIFKYVTDFRDPYKALAKFVDCIPDAADQLIGYEDTLIFISLCKRRGQKPVPFISVLDEEFETWFKKDSLWQSEDLNAVVGRDVGRVCILHGPVAVQYSKTVDEPIKSILDTIHHGHINHMVEDLYNGNRSEIPEIECFGLDAYNAPLVDASIQPSQDAKALSSPVDASSLSTEAWIASLAGSRHDWRQAILTAHSVVTSSSTVIPNPVVALLKKTRADYVTVEDRRHEEGSPISFFELQQDGTMMKTVEIGMTRDKTIALDLFEHRNANNSPVALRLEYIYEPNKPFAPIREVSENRNERIRDFYYGMWFNEPLRIRPSIYDEFSSPVTEITRDAVLKFIRTIKKENMPQRKNGRIIAPLDFAMVMGWQAITKPLFAREIDCDLLALVHLSNEFRTVESSEPIQEGDRVSAKAKVTSIVNQASGKMIEVRGQVLRQDLPIIEINTKFLVRGTFADYQTTFQRSQLDTTEVTLARRGDVEVLKQKKWFQLAERDFDLFGRSLVFRAESFTRFGQSGLPREVDTLGSVEYHEASGVITKIGSVDYKSKLAGEPVCRDAVASYLRRHGKVFGKPLALEKPVTLFPGESITVNAPSTNCDYSRASGDFNPIHVSPAFAQVAGLPAPIVHGMRTSAQVRGLAERLLCGGDSTLFKNFSCNFTGKVLADDLLEISMVHVAMSEGSKVINIEACKADSKEVVLKGQCEILPAPTAYLFTGQGSQKKGMGMKLYEESPAARKIWDFADATFSETYGTCIALQLDSLQIVHHLTLLQASRSRMSSRTTPSP